MSMLDYAGQWEHDVDAKVASVTMVAEGNCQLQGREDRLIRLSRGDCVIAPRGSAYRLAADIEARPSTSNATRVITLGYVLRESSPVLAALPDLMFIRSAELRHGDWPALVEDFLGDEENAGQPGYRAAAASLATLILIALVRARVLRNPREPDAWLRATADPRIGRSLAAIGVSPGLSWTVATLAREACMSRSAFASLFQAQIGQPPIDYLRGWRMRLAAQRIAVRRPVLAVAAELGYRSERAFRKAFKQHFGVSPGCYGKTARHDPPTLTP